MDTFTQTRLNPEDRQARQARIRAQRGTPEREAKITEMQVAKDRAAQAEAAAALEDRAFTRAFNCADLRTQAAMLATTTDGPLADLLNQAAATLPAGF